MRLEVDTPDAESRSSAVGRARSYLARSSPPQQYGLSSTNLREQRSVDFNVNMERSSTSDDVTNLENTTKNPPPSGKLNSELSSPSYNTSSRNVGPSMNWNRRPSTMIRTSLRSSSNISQSPNQSQVSAASVRPVQEGLHLISSDAAHTVRADDSTEIISLSDESSVEPAQDSRSIVLNLDNRRKTEMAKDNGSIEVSDEEGDSSFMIDTKGVPIQNRDGEEIDRSVNAPFAMDGAPYQTQILGALSDNSIVNADESSHQASSEKKADIARKLSDLSQEDLNDQLKYALFYLDREQIDLNRPVMCLFCLEEGHMQDLCPLKTCEHCGAWDEHFSQNCPQWRRCLKCRERGHHVSKCNSKLKDNSVPCDLCGSGSHIEDKCCLQWNIAKRRQLDTPVELYLCCANCGGNNHLIGDCPQLRSNGHLAAWTLKDLDFSKIVNLSFQKGARKGAADGWGPKPELRIKGRARKQQAPEPDDMEDEDVFFGPRVAQKERSHIRFGEDRLDIKRLKLDDGSRGGYDSYQPSNRTDRYEPPTRGRRDDDYDRYYNPFHDDRRRSRSPPRDDRRAPHSIRDSRFRHPLPPPSPPRGSSRTHSGNVRGGSMSGTRRGSNQPKTRNFGRR